MADIYKARAKEILKETLSIIKGKKEYRGTVLVMAPIFTAENIGEGYIQRVKAIDEEILGQSYNIYLDFETKNEYPTILQIDARHLYITFNKNSKACVTATIAIAKHCNSLYTHSVMRAMADIVGEDIHRLYRKKEIFKIWDVHGAAPEEFALADNYYEAQNAGAAEALFIENSNVIITVNHAMKKHLEKKYNKKLDNVIVLPIFNKSEINVENLLLEKADVKKATAVYAGGLQDWQNIPLMQEIIKKLADDYNYKIFVSKPEEYKNMWGDFPLPQDGRIECITPSEVLKEYESCHYGFVLRDDIIVNNVACPTKLIEYLQYGVIPIVKTENIGDFVKLGMRYIAYADFGRIPYNKEKYLEMARENAQLPQKLAKAHEDGKKELLVILYEQFDI